MVRKIFILGVIILSLLGCTKIEEANIKNKKITKENENKILEEIKDRKGFTFEESQLLVSYLVRHNVAKSLGENQSLEGKTMGELIEEEKKFEKEEALKEAETKRLAEKAKAEESRIAKELRETIMVAPFKKEFRKSNWELGTYEDYNVIHFVFENKSDKDIRAFKGYIIFKDLFGEEIKKIGLSYDKEMKAKTKINWPGSIEYNQFNDSDNKLRNKRLKDMKFEWIPQTVLFVDGTKIGEIDNR